jgi:Mlc titration factor MtfA (ptsG expression regulator)
MLGNWWKQRRRRKILARPFPAAWELVLHENFAIYRRLSTDERQRLNERSQIFVAEKYWEGCGGLVMTDEIRITIAAQACLLVLGLEHEFYDRLLSVLVYPTGYFADERRHLPAGVVSEETVLRLGEAWTSGPVILSWDDVLDGGRFPGNGRNVVFHEFAHVLDLDHSGPDGTPELADAERYRTWHEVMTAEYNRLRRRSERRQKTLLDPYGATDEAEFFAVATETFFERPLQLADQHPQLFPLLRDFFRQDPRRWAEGLREAPPLS